MEITDEEAGALVAMVRQRTAALALVASILEIDSEDISTNIINVKKQFTITMLELLKSYPVGDMIDMRMWEAMKTCMEPLSAEEEAKAILKDLDKSEE